MNHLQPLPSFCLCPWLIVHHHYAWAPQQTENKNAPSVVFLQILINSKKKEFISYNICHSFSKSTFNNCVSLLKEKFIARDIFTRSFYFCQLPMPTTTKITGEHIKSFQKFMQPMQTSDINSHNISGFHTFMIYIPNTKLKFSTWHAVLFLAPELS